MPITKSAKKKLRQDKKRAKQNFLVKKTVKKEIKEFKKHPDIKILSKIYRLIDHAVKKKIFHKNKGGRLKSSLTKLLSQTIKKRTSSPPEKKSSQKK